MADEQKMKEIHDKLSARILADLDDEERRGPELYRVALAFLQKNGIGQLPVPGSATEKIREKVRSTAPFSVTG